VLIVARVIFQRRNPRPTHACHSPRCPWATREGRARKGHGAGLGLRRPGDARPPRHATTATLADSPQGTRGSASNSLEPPSLHFRRHVPLYRLHFRTAAFEAWKQQGGGQRHDPEPELNKELPAKDRRQRQRLPGNCLLASPPGGEGRQYQQHHHAGRVVSPVSTSAVISLRRRRHQ